MTIINRVLEMFNVTAFVDIECLMTLRTQTETAWLWDACPVRVVVSEIPESLPRH